MLIMSLEPMYISTRMVGYSSLMERPSLAVPSAEKYVRHALQGCHLALCLISTTKVVQVDSVPRIRVQLYLTRKVIQQGRAGRIIDRDAPKGGPQVV